MHQLTDHRADGRTVCFSRVAQCVATLTSSGDRSELFSTRGGSARFHCSNRRYGKWTTSMSSTCPRQRNLSSCRYAASYPSKHQWDSEVQINLVSTQQHEFERQVAEKQLSKGQVRCSASPFCGTSLIVFCNESQEWEWAGGGQWLTVSKKSSMTYFRM